MSFGRVVACVVALCGCRGASPAPTSSAAPPAASPADAPTIAVAPAGAHLRTVFLIVMENTNWSELHRSTHAPFLRGLLATAAHADHYGNPPGVHPSEPNYIWLEAGSALAIATDADPSRNHRATTAHLTALLRDANIPWKAYEQSITGTECPLVSKGAYAAKHDPFVYFDDVTGHGRTDDPYCLAHVRPLDELEHDLASADTTPRYLFITPDLCHDMHDSCPPLNDRTAQGDRWLATQVAMIEASPAYRAGGAIFVTWDESEGADVPIGMIVISPFAKPAYVNDLVYTHSSTLKTVEEILGVAPLLGDAAAPETRDLSDLFTAFP